VTVFAKDPSSSLDYSFDWSSWLTPGENIITDSWSVTPPTAGTLTLSGGSRSGGLVSTNVAGGQVGDRYRLSCQIETDLGRTAERSAAIRVMEV